MLRLKELREQNNISQKELGQMLKVAQNSISNWENGIREPDTATLDKLADFFDISVDYLLCRSDKKNPPETIAAHHDGDEWTEEELEAIEQFKDFILERREKRGEDK